MGYVFPKGEGPGVPEGPFGPIEKPLDQFLQLTKIPIQIIWGDNIDQVEGFKPAVAQSRLFAELINQYGGNAQVLMLPDIGITGNTHLPFADMNNVQIADLLSEFLNLNGLD